MCSIPIRCPKCQSFSVKKNGLKPNGKQNYFCKQCGRQFIGDHAISYKGCHSRINQKILRMCLNGCGVRDIARIEQISCGKILSVILNICCEIKPSKSYYEGLEIDEFWTFVGSKKNKLWLIYAYDGIGKEVVAYQWGKRNRETVSLLKRKIQKLGVSFSVVYTDKWNGFISVFKDCLHLRGKRYTTSIEGFNCYLRHRIKRVFRRVCCFSKSIQQHKKLFDLVFGWVKLENVVS